MGRGLSGVCCPFCGEQADSEFAPYCSPDCAEEFGEGKFRVVDFSVTIEGDGIDDEMIARIISSVDRARPGSPSRVLEGLLSQGVEVSLRLDLDGNYRARVLKSGMMFWDVVVATTMDELLQQIYKRFGSANEPLAERNS